MQRNSFIMINNNKNYYYLNYMSFSRMNSERIYNIQIINELSLIYSYNYINYLC